jgi:predicted DNA-binding protein (MmcQ/YjbR family)
MQTLDAVRTYLLSKATATEDFPFGPETLVAKVGNKMFALVGLDADPLTLALKCDPLQAEQLRGSFAAIGLPSYLDKRHWISITLDGSVPDDLIQALIDDSYALVVKGLTRAVRRELGLL